MNNEYFSLNVQDQSPSIVEAYGYEFSCFVDLSKITPGEKESGLIHETTPLGSVNVFFDEFGLITQIVAYQQGTVVNSNKITYPVAFNSHLAKVLAVLLEVEFELPKTLSISKFERDNTMSYQFNLYDYHASMMAKSS